MVKAAVLALVLAGCTQVSEGVETIKDAADEAAKIAIQWPCGVTIGSFYRVLSRRYRAGVTLLCDPDATLPE